MPENVATIVTIVTSVLSFFFAIFDISILVKKVKNKKLYQILLKLPDYICDAESIFGNGKGSAKLSSVLQSVRCDCLESGVKFDKEGFTAEVNRILKTPQSKEVQNETNESKQEA